MKGEKALLIKTELTNLKKCSKKKKENSKNTVKKILEEIAIFVIFRELLRMKDGRACLMFKKLNDWKESSKEKFKNLEPITKIIWQCKGNHS